MGSFRSTGGPEIVWESLIWLGVGREEKTVECGLQNRLEVAGFAVDRADSNDHVEDLLELEVVADFKRASTLAHNGVLFLDKLSSVSPGQSDSLLSAGRSCGFALAV
jgi:hypothetical protein